MRFDPARCPTCGEPPEGTLETIPGVAILSELDDGSFEYAGETRVFWDGQMTDTLDGQPLLMCARGHDWSAARVTEVVTA